MSVRARVQVTGGTSMPLLDSFGDCALSAPWCPVLEDRHAITPSNAPFLVLIIRFWG